MKVKRPFWVRVKGFVVPEVKRATWPAWHFKWPWGMVQCWDRDKRMCGVKIGRFALGIRNDWPWRTAFVHIHCGKLEAWSKRKGGNVRPKRVHRHDCAVTVNARHECSCGGHNH